MAHFIGSVQGNRGGASRLGSKKSGMDASTGGWDIGARIWAREKVMEGVSDNRRVDTVRIDIDGGSNARSYAHTIADAVEIKDTDGRISGVKVVLYGADRKEVAKFILPR